MRFGNCGRRWLAGKTKILGHPGPKTAFTFSYHLERLHSAAAGSFLKNNSQIPASALTIGQTGRERRAPRVGSLLRARLHRKPLQRPPAQEPAQPVIDHRAGHPRRLALEP